QATDRLFRGADPVRRFLLGPAGMRARDIERAAGRTDDPLVAVDQHRLDARRSKIETEIHDVYSLRPQGRLSFRKISMRIRSCAANTGSPSAFAFSTRMALRTSWPASWLRTASIVPSRSAWRVEAVSSWAMTTGLLRGSFTSRSARIRPRLPAPRL